MNETKLFLAHLMTYGILEDIVTAMNYCSDADFVLRDPLAGIFDLRSWNYRNLRTGMNRFRPYHNVSFPKPTP